MHYFFGQIDEETHTAIIKDEEAHHCAIVLRLKPKEQIGILTQTGNIYIAELLSIHKKQCTAKIISVKKYSESKIKLHLVISPPKNNERLEWIVEKSAELQVHSILFVKSERCIRKSLNINRLQQIAYAAIKQSANPFSIQLSEYKNLNELLNSIISLNSKYLLLHCENTSQKIILNTTFIQKLQHSNISNIYAFIGPEGDWTIKEIETIKTLLKDNVYEITLGESRLRTETAAISIASMSILLRN